MAKYPVCCREVKDKKFDIWTLPGLADIYLLPREALSNSWGAICPSEL